LWDAVDAVQRAQEATHNGGVGVCVPANPERLLQGGQEGGSLVEVVERMNKPAESRQQCQMFGTTYAIATKPMCCVEGKRPSLAITNHSLTSSSAALHSDLSSLRSVAKHTAA